MLQMMELLLKHKANAYLTDAVGNTALHALGMSFPVFYLRTPETVMSPRCLHVSFLWMRPSRVFRASFCQCRSRNSPTPGFDPSFLRHSGIWGAADEAVLKTVHKKILKNPPFKSFLLNSFQTYVTDLLVHSFPLNLIWAAKDQYHGSISTFIVTVN